MPLYNMEDGFVVVFTLIYIEQEKQKVGSIFFFV